MAELRVLPPAAKFLKKLKDKKLKSLYREAIDAGFADIEGLGDLPSAHFKSEELCNDVFVV